MVVQLEPGVPWELEWEEGVLSISCPFASASAPHQNARLDATVNDELMESVHLQVPHSWWGGSGQYVWRTDPLRAGKHTAKLEVFGGPAVVRLDLVEIHQQGNRPK